MGVRLCFFLGGVRLCYLYKSASPRSRNTESKGTRKWEKTERNRPFLQPLEVKTQVWCYQTAGMIRTNNRDDQGKQPRRPDQTTEMTASKGRFDQQNQRDFIVKSRCRWRWKHAGLVITYASANYNKAIGIRKIEGNIGGGSENRSHEGGKVSVYSTYNNMNQYPWSNILYSL